MSRVELPNAGRGRNAADDDPVELRGTGRTSRGRETRRRLVAGARTVFERDGFLRARIADICAEAGISQPSFYTHFRSKEEIFSEVVSEVDLDMLTMPVHGDDLDPVERIRDANRHFLELYRDHGALLAVIDQVATFDERVFQERTERQRRLARAIERRIRMHQDEGITDPRLDAAFAARALASMVNAVARNLYGRGDPTGDIGAAVEQLTLLWATAIGLEPGEEPTREVS
jgi:AcrR family transcriptional regulator